MTQKEKQPLSDYFRRLFEKIINSAAGFFHRIGVSPNMATILGLLGHIVAAVFLANGQLMWGGLIILITAPFDVLDGTIARLFGKTTSFGAFFDSVVDRYEEIILLAGLLWFFLHQNDLQTSFVIFLAVTGSILVSYIRSRAECLDFDARVGILTRFERYVVLVPALLFNFPFIGLVILAVLSHFTALQRAFFVAKQAHERNEL